MVGAMRFILCLQKTEDEGWVRARATFVVVVVVMKEVLRAGGPVIFGVCVLMC